MGALILSIGFLSIALHLYFVRTNLPLEDSFMPRFFSSRIVLLAGAVVAFHTTFLTLHAPYRECLPD